jgi:quinol monooxygenase YgiN
MPLLHTAHLKVREDAVAPFEARLAHHAAITMEREPGCLRFDFFQEKSDPTLFLLYEIYADEEALQLHRSAPHYLSFREDVKNWVVKRDWWFWRWSRESKSPPST